MLTSTEYLIEILSDADDLDFWWEEVGSAEEAKELLKAVKKESHDERESATLLSFFDEPGLFEMSLAKAFNKCLSILNRRIRPKE